MPTIIFKDGIFNTNDEHTINALDNFKHLKGGFFDLPKEQRCNHVEHEPPKHLYIPQGKGYRHICPACGAESIIIPPQISF